MNRKEYWIGQLDNMDGNPLIPWSVPQKKEGFWKQYAMPINQETVKKIMHITKGNDMLTFIFLLASVKVLLWKFTNQKSINIFVPPYLKKNAANQSNRYLPVIDQINSQESFKNFLAQVKNTVLDGYENQFFPLSEIIREKGEAYQNAYYDTGIYLIFQDLHDACDVNNIRNHPASQCVFTFLKGGEKRKLIFHCKDSIQEYQVMGFLKSFLSILDYIVCHGDEKICRIPLPDDEKLLLTEESSVNLEYLGDDFLTRLQRVTEKAPDHTAISVSVNIEDILIELESDQDHEELFQKLGTCCFTKCRFSFIKQVNGKEKKSYFVKLFNNRCFYLNYDMYLLLEHMEGTGNLNSLFEYVSHPERSLLIQAIDPNQNDMTSVTYHGGREEAAYQTFIRFIKEVYALELIQLTGINESMISLSNSGITKDSLKECGDEEQDTAPDEADLLLIGDTPGMPTVGILYLASYMVRNGVKAKCLYYEKSTQEDTLSETIVNAVKKYRPEYVGVSMKWFPHIYRVLKICRIIKSHFPELKMIVGGDTASCFYRDIIKFESVDFVIRGDGELPLLELCKGNLNAPNIVYKHGQTVVKNPMTYIQDEHNSNDVYLSDMSKILPSKEDLLNGTFYIYTHKGCSMNCIYCGGGRPVQELVFRRKRPYIRNPQTVRKDVILMKEYCSTFMFDFDDAADGLLDYCKEVLEQIDVSKHFCVIFSLSIPSDEVIDYISSKFLYVRWNLDVCSLSKRHRDILQQKGMVKKQPDDDEIYRFFQVCELYDNVHVDMNMVLGLPYFTEEDITENEKVIQKIAGEYSCFYEMNWGRLHAQPGTCLAGHAKEYGMVSYASSFEDFYRYSKMNYERKSGYPALKDYSYPYILYEDAALNTKISGHYQKMMLYIQQQKKLRRQKQFIFSRISYQELRIQSDQAAQGLKESNVKPGDLVIVYMKNPIHAAVAMIGIMKIQAVYLPVDEESTDLRIQSMILDSKAEFLVTDKQCPVQIKTIIPFDLLLGPGEKFDAAIETMNQEKPVYAIYTSGSAGIPKGVVIKRKSLNNLIQWRTKEYEFRESNRTLEILSMAFDAFYGDFFCSLATGGSVYIIDKAHKCDPIALSFLIRQEKITNMSVLPSFYAQLLNTAEAGSLQSLQFVVLGGERPDGKMIEKSRQLSDHTVLINEYGPTEAAITTTYHRGIDEKHPAILGRPIVNMNIMILNSDGNLMPKGFLGELCITGIGLAEGYLNQEEMTKERFQKYPYGDDRMMYRTGDLAFYTKEGETEIGGRIDSQVKVLGYRMECSGIELALLNVPEVKEAVVTAKETARGMRQLVAFLVLEKAETDIRSIREKLGESLPQYMIPARFIRMEEIPKTINGKYDRRALECYRLPDYRETQKRHRDKGLEEAILNIWKEVLQTESIESCDNFFENGGNSILLMQVYYKLQNKITNNITITDLFSYPTVQLLTEYIEKMDGKHSKN